MTQEVYDSTGRIQIYFQRVHNSTGGIPISFLGGGLTFHWSDSNSYLGVKHSTGGIRFRYLFWGFNILQEGFRYPSCVQWYLILKKNIVCCSCTSLKAYWNYPFIIKRTLRGQRINSFQLKFNSYH